jgi:hypothetical protein
MVYVLIFNMISFYNNQRMIVQFYIECTSAAKYKKRQIVQKYEYSADWGNGVKIQHKRVDYT